MMCRRNSRSASWRVTRLDTLSTDTAPIGHLVSGMVGGSVPVERRDRDAAELRFDPGESRGSARARASGVSMVEGWCRCRDHLDSAARGSPGGVPSAGPRGASAWTGVGRDQHPGDLHRTADRGHASASHGRGAAGSAVGRRTGRHAGTRAADERGGAAPAPSGRTSHAPASATRARQAGNPAAGARRARANRARTGCARARACSGSGPRPADPTRAARAPKEAAPDRSADACAVAHRRDGAAARDASRAFVDRSKPSAAGQPDGAGIRRRTVSGPAAPGRRHGEQPAATLSRECATTRRSGPGDRAGERLGRR